MRYWCRCRCVHCGAVDGEDGEGDAREEGVLVLGVRSLWMMMHDERTLHDNQVDRAGYRQDETR